MKSALTNAIYLQDSWVEIFGIKIYGSPWVPLPNFKVNWAFGLQRGEVKTIVSSVVEFKRWGVLKRNNFGQESTYYQENF